MMFGNVYFFYIFCIKGTKVNITAFWLAWPQRVEMFQNSEKKNLFDKTISTN